MRRQTSSEKLFEALVTLLDQQIPGIKLASIVTATRLSTQESTKYQMTAPILQYNDSFTDKSVYTHWYKDTIAKIIKCIL